MKKETCKNCGLIDNKMDSIIKFCERCKNGTLPESVYGELDCLQCPFQSLTGGIKNEEKQ